MALRSLRRAAQLGSTISTALKAAAVNVASELRPLQELVLHSNHSQHTWGSSQLLPSQPWYGQSRGLRFTALLQENFSVVVPQLAESVSEGTIATFVKKEGDTVKEDDVIAQIETDKVTVDVKYTGREPGVITKLLVKPGDTVTVGAQLANVDMGGAAASKPASEAKPEAAKTEAPKQEAPKPEAPKAGSKAQPTTKPDAPKPMPANPPPPSTTAPAQPAAPAAPTPKAPKPERRVKMTRLRQRVAERLKNAQNTYAMLTTFNEVDMTEIMALRNTFKDAFLEKHGVKLGFMSAFVKAAAYALQEVPAVNGVIDGDEIIYRDYYDISIAVATPKGLVVPVLRKADELSFADVERTINELGKKAREGTISIDDMAGGTFTISNGGVYGSMMSTPIINPPQSAILGMHGINQRAMVVGGKIEARPMMYIALTYDHRLIDGREAVTFLKRVKDVVEDPRRLLLDI